MDERMLKTGTVPVSDQLNRLPAAGTGERKSQHSTEVMDISGMIANHAASHSQKQAAKDRGRRRGSRVGEVAGRDGHVMMLRSPCSYFLPSIIRSPI